MLASLASSLACSAFAMGLSQRSRRFVQFSRSGALMDEGASSSEHMVKAASIVGSCFPADFYVLPSPLAVSDEHTARFLLQSAQWQTPIRKGSPQSEYCTDPHAQPPLRIARTLRPFQVAPQRSWGSSSPLE